MLLEEIAIYKELANAQAAVDQADHGLDGFVTRVSNAVKKNRDVRDVGMRKQLIDKLNATRREAHGGLGKLSFENPKLSRDFAEIFFYSEAPRDEEQSIDEVKDSIQELGARWGRGIWGAPFKEYRTRRVHLTPCPFGVGTGQGRWVAWSGIRGKPIAR